MFLQGAMNLNRAVHEDIVAVEILPKDQWTRPSSVVTSDVTAEESDEEKSEVMFPVRLHFIASFDVSLHFVA